MKHAFAGLALVLSACTQIVTDPLPDRTVDGTFQAKVLNWTNGAQLTFAVKLVEAQGRTGICGAWAESTGSGVNQTQFNDRMIGSMYVDLEGKILVNDISFFRKGSWRQHEPPIGQAACRLTDLPWRDRYAGQAEFKAAKTSFVVYD